MKFLLSFIYDFRYSFDYVLNSALMQARMLWSKLKLALGKVLHFWYTLVLTCAFNTLHDISFLSINDVECKQLPAIETVLKALSKNSPQRVPVPPILVLILCPTRELASQIAAELKALLKYHEGIGVQTLVGGIRFKDDQKRLESDPSQVCIMLA